MKLINKVIKQRKLKQNFGSFYKNIFIKDDPNLLTSQSNTPDNLPATTTQEDKLRPGQHQISKTDLKDGNKKKTTENNLKFKVN